MKPGITTLRIEGFRTFRKLKIEGMGRVNLIAGRNNTGKSSVLEALRILAAEASPSVLYSILQSREEVPGEVEDAGRPTVIKDIFQMTSIFSGFPQLTDDPKPIIIKTDRNTRPSGVTLRLVWFTEELNADGKRRVITSSDLLDGKRKFPALGVEADGRKRFIEMDSPLRRSFFSQFDEESNLRCVYVNPYGGESTATLGSLWDSIALSDHENDVVEAMHIIDPDISAVSMIASVSSRLKRTAIVRSKNFERPVPLRSFGDGLNRLFGIVLSLVNARNGLLLIDEFENGIHHTVQLDMWRVIFRQAQKLNVQVFATSHSWDAIEAFTKAALETQEEGVLIRLSRKENDIIPTVFREDELAVATRDRIEVR